MKFCNYKRDNPEINCTSFKKTEVSIVTVLLTALILVMTRGLFRDRVSELSASNITQDLSLYSEVLSLS